MSTSLTIGGADKASLVNWKSVLREEVLTKEPNKLKFSLKKHDGQTYKPSVGDEVVLTVGGTKEFGGYITEMNEEIDGRVEEIRCICKDYTHELDRQLVSKTYEDQTVNQIISDLLSTFSTGFTDNNVDCPVTVEKIVFNYLTISKCLERLTELVGEYEWYVDYDKDIHFFASSSETASFNLTDTSANYVFNSLEVKEDTHQLRNNIIVRGGFVTNANERTEFIYGNGSQKLFPLASKFASVPSVSINNSSINVGIDFLNEETGYQAMWDYNQKYLRFINALESGTTTVTGFPQYPLIYQKLSESSITTYGNFEYVIVDKNIRDLETASLRADAEILRYSIPSKTATFETYTDGLQAGQTINIQSDIRSLNDDFKVQMIRSKLRTPNNDDFIHTIEAVTADDIGINDVLSKLLIKNPSDQIDVSQDEVVSRIRQFKDTFGIEDNTPTVATTSGPYTWAGFNWGFGTWES